MVVMSDKAQLKAYTTGVPQESTLGQFEWLVHQYQGQVAMQRDPDTLEKGPARNLTKFCPFSQMELSCTYREITSRTRTCWKVAWQERT